MRLMSTRSMPVPAITFYPSVLADVPLLPIQKLPHVFVVDRAGKRFILGETKDVPGATRPKEIRGQRRQFVGDVQTQGNADRSFLGKLIRQETWFSSRIDALKSEFGIDDPDEYTVEGVIIVNGPFLWVYLYRTPLPILDDFEFVRCLISGRSMLIEAA